MPKKRCRCRHKRSSALARARSGVAPSKPRRLLITAPLSPRSDPYSSQALRSSMARASGPLRLQTQRLTLWQVGAMSTCSCPICSTSQTSAASPAYRRIKRHWRSGMLLSRVTPRATQDGSPATRRITRTHKRSAGERRRKGPPILAATAAYWAWRIWPCLRYELWWCGLYRTAQCPASGRIPFPDRPFRGDERLPQRDRRLPPHAGGREHRSLGRAGRPLVRPAHVEVPVGSDRRYDVHAQEVVPRLVHPELARYLRHRSDPRRRRFARRADSDRADLQSRFDVRRDGGRKLDGVLRAGGSQGAGGRMVPGG